MGNAPQGIFVMTTSITLAAIGLFFLGCVAIIINIFLRKMRRSEKITEARNEILERERLNEKQQKRTADERYWKNMMSQIEKEYHGF